MLTFTAVAFCTILVERNFFSFLHIVLSHLACLKVLHVAQAALATLLLSVFTHLHQAKSGAVGFVSFLHVLICQQFFLNC